jgi:ribonucleoside-diphosphate reductase alpha chain
MNFYGPQHPECDKMHQDKYRAPGETFREAMTRVASNLMETQDDFQAARDILLQMRFLPGGRIQSAIGSSRATTPYNCYVSGTIEDSFTEGSGSIMARAREAAITMRMGGGIGYDFSTLRPRGALIKKLQSHSSGPVPFMEIFDAVCRATSSSGARRGAQMGVLRVDHPDIEEFIRAKQRLGYLTGFNISIAVTDAFMEAVKNDTEFQLQFAGTPYRKIWARPLWDSIMRSTYDWAEPGVLFIDRINAMNNLYYCEKICATNPCGEQPLPPFGACLLGSFNLTQYLSRDRLEGPWSFNYEQFFLDIPYVVKMMDRVVDVARYPLHEQENEAHNKRRMGLGVTGLANTVEAMGHPYGSPSFISHMSAILRSLRDAAYTASAHLAKEKGSFPLYDKDKYLEGRFIQGLSTEALTAIEQHGIRNSHLLSIAPTGTISYSADNVSSGIEPVFAHKVTRTVIEASGPREIDLEDYGSKYLGVKGKTAEECSTEDHLNVLIAASRFVDSAVSKTCNVPQNIEWNAFKQIYIKAWEAGCKGCTTYRKGGLREGILKEAEPKEAVLEPLTCEIDPSTGRKNCE